ncbi:MAG: UvrB/UvrC motif-containing protein [Clostridia bacterium]|nr:UvrB/UvrC motif-containing protein [Clostridia bacterium]MBR0509085.1 UvrB/UvrC motif-containing protein [Clostridia bacterium]MBR0537824.1 UvrB/UvrC motif-containing protein [Clostridia bacterium]
MLCQNCRTRDAGIHLKHIVNGEAGEIHLCAQCAATLGYSDIFSGFPLDPFHLTAASVQMKTLGSRQQRCEVCGFTFDDIARTLSPGCPNCYRVFRSKIAPAIVKLHGRTVFKGTPPDNGAADSAPPSPPKTETNAEKAAALREEMREAVEREDFERAGELRDEIRRLQKEEE